MPLNEGKYFAKADPSEDDELLMSSTATSGESALELGAAGGGSVTLPEDMIGEQKARYIEALFSEISRRDLEKFHSALSEARQVQGMYGGGATMRQSPRRPGQGLGPGGAQALGEIGLSVVYPPAGVGFDVRDLGIAWEEKDPIGGGLSAAGLLLLPAMGFTKTMKHGWRAIKAGDFSADAIKAVTSPKAISAAHSLDIANLKRTENLGVKLEALQEVSKTSPEARDAARRLRETIFELERMKRPSAVLDVVADIGENQATLKRLEDGINWRRPGDPGREMIDEVSAEVGRKHAHEALVAQHKQLTDETAEMIERVQRDMGKDPTWLQVVSTKTGAAPDLKPTTQLETARSVDPTEAFIQPERLHSIQAGARTATEIMPGLQDVQHGLGETRGMSASELEPLMSTQEIPISRLGKVPPGPSRGTMIQNDPEAQLLVEEMRREGGKTEMFYSPKSKETATTPTWKPAPGGPPPPMPPVPGIDAPYPLGGPPPALPWRRPASQAVHGATREMWERELLHDALRAAGFENPSSVLDAFEAAQK